MPDDMESKIYEILEEMKHLDRFYDYDFVTLEEYFKIKDRMIQSIISVSRSNLKEKQD